MSISSPARIITVADYKSIMRIGDTAQDTHLAAILPSALRGIEEYCGRKFCNAEEEALSLYCNSEGQEALSLYCNAGDASAATVAVTATTMVLLITGGASAGTNTLTFSNADKDTMTELVAVIEALDGWTATLIGTAGWASTALAVVSATGCLGAGNAATLLTEAPTAATAEVTESALVLTITGGVDAGINTLTFADTANDTLTELVAVIEALAGWTATLIGTGTAASTDLTPAAAQSCLAVANTVTLGIRVDITEYFDGKGKATIYPTYLPLTSITSIYDDLDRDYEAGDLIDDDYYVMYDNRVALDGQRFANGLKNVKLVYRGGYTATQLASDDLSDLRQAACMYLALQIQQMDIGAVQATVDLNTGVETRYSAFPMPWKIGTKLARFVNKGYF
jgi:hypothetical protein